MSKVKVTVHDNLPTEEELHELAIKVLMDIQSPYPEIDSYFGFDAEESVNKYKESMELFNPYSVKGGPQEYLKAARAAGQGDLVEYIEEQVSKAHRNVAEIANGMVEYLRNLIVYVNSKDLEDIKRDLSDTEFLIDKISSKKEMLEVLRAEYADIYLNSDGDKDFILESDESFAKLFSLFKK